MAVTITLGTTYTIPAIILGKWTLATSLVGGEHWLRNQSLNNTAGISLRDEYRPSDIEIRATNINTSKWQRALCASGTVFGSKARPYNIVVERLKGTYTSSRGTSMLTNATAWLRPATMRTRSTVRAARLTRPETIVSKKGAAS